MAWNDACICILTSFGTDILVMVCWFPHLSTILTKWGMSNLRFLHILGECSQGMAWNLEWCILTTLTHWGRVTHICVGNLTIIGSDNGLSLGRHQAIIWTNVGILLFGPLGTNFSEILIGIQTFSYKKMHLKMASVKWRPFRIGLNVLRID